MPGSIPQLLRCSLPKPAHGFLTIQEPLRGKDGGALDGLFPRIWESRRHDECEFSNAGSAISRNDMRVAPLHHAVPKSMPELECVDEQATRPGFLCLPDEEAERGHEATVRHAGRGCQPLQLQRVRVLNDYAPLIPHYFRRHSAPSARRWRL